MARAKITRAKPCGRSSREDAATHIDVTAERVGRNRIDVLVVIYRGPKPAIELRFRTSGRDAAVRDVTPQASDIRKNRCRDNADVAARERSCDELPSLQGAVMIGNSVLRVVSDAMVALAHLVMRYIDWVALQLRPDTAEKEWLDRHGDICLRQRGWQQDARTRRFRSAP